MNSQLPHPERILVIMLRRIGDVLLTTPAVRALRKIYPRAQIDFLVEPPADQVLAGNRDLSSVLVYGGAFRGLSDVRKRGYDWVIDYMGNPRTAVLTALSGAQVKAGPGHATHRWAYSHKLRQSHSTCYSALEKIRMLRSLGLDPDESEFLPILTIPPSSQDFADKALKGFPEPIVGLAPASRKVTRRWPAASFAALGRMLRDRGASILVFWGPGEIDLAREVCQGIGARAFLSPQTKDLQDLAALIGRCQALVTNCNGPKHIAVARGVPTLTIHASSDPAAWNPPDPCRHPVARREDLPCIACGLNRCPYNLECVRQLAPEHVFDQAEKLLTL